MQEKSNVAILLDTDSILVMGLEIVFDTTRAISTPMISTAMPEPSSARRLQLKYSVCFQPYSSPQLYYTLFLLWNCDVISKKLVSLQK